MMVDPRKVLCRNLQNSITNNQRAVDVVNLKGMRCETVIVMT